MNDYVFLEGPRDLNGADSPVSSVRLSELFSRPTRALIVYHFMFGKRQTAACPMCTMWIDTFNGIAPHLAQHAVVVGAAHEAIERGECARSQ